MRPWDEPHQRWLASRAQGAMDFVRGPKSCRCSVRRGGRTECTEQSKDRLADQIAHVIAIRKRKRLDNKSARGPSTKARTPQQEHPEARLAAATSDTRYVRGKLLPEMLRRRTSVLGGFARKCKRVDIISRARRVCGVEAVLCVKAPRCPIPYEELDGLNNDRKCRAQLSG